MKASTWRLICLAVAVWLAWQCYGLATWPMREDHVEGR